jgi:hypothetical protein
VDLCIGQAGREVADGRGARLERPVADGEEHSPRPRLDGPPFQGEHQTESQEVGGVQQRLGAAPSSDAGSALDQVRHAASRVLMRAVARLINTR